MANPVFHFEIPVTDMDRAIAFYRTVFDLELRRDNVDGYEMAFFPRDDINPGTSGALAKGDVYKPSHDGTIIYFDVADIDIVFERTVAAGSRVLYKKTDIGTAGFVGEIEDSEGNRIALTQASSPYAGKKVSFAHYTRPHSIIPTYNAQKRTLGHWQKFADYRQF